MSARATKLARARVPAFVLTLGLLGGCHGGGSSAPALDSLAPPAELAAQPSEAQAAPAPAPAPPAPDPYTPASTLPDPLEVRFAERTRLAYAQPEVHAGDERDEDSAIRGRIHAREHFYVYERREGPGCKRDWAKVAEQAWVCLERTSEAKPGSTPRALPVLEGAALLPFIYARHRKHKDASTAPIPVYRSAKAYRRGDAPIETLPAYGSYAFTKVRERGGEVILQTPEHHMVEGSALELFEPSEFSGVELEDFELSDPSHTLGWAVRWKTMIHAEPDPRAPTLARIEYHDTLELGGEQVQIEAEEPADREWIAVPAHADVPAGWVRLDEVRRFLPSPPPEPVLGGQLTLDVDLDEQVLSVWREREAVFVTLISSGKKSDRTPTGLYRITTKRAYGKMSSLPSAKDPYYVDAVPWTLYFQGRYAFHTAYWHDMFGHRMSHGCVNLSPKDARRVFELATPTLPPGWLQIHESARDPGALVRVRRRDAELPDRREPPALASDSSG